MYRVGMILPAYVSSELVISAIFALLVSCWYDTSSLCIIGTLPFRVESRYEVVKWMLDRQLDRRSPNKKKRTYVIGRRYLVEKRESVGRPEGTKECPQNGAINLNKTSKVIANQLGIGKNTVINAAKFTEAVDKIVQVTGVKVNDLLDDEIT